MTTKNSTSQQLITNEDRKTTEEKHYAIISKESIRMYGESTTHSNLSEEIATLMGEDVSYRLREVVQTGFQFMRHCRRKKLTTSDINKALHSMDVQPVYGYGSGDPLPFIKVKDNNLYHPADKYISLVDVCSSPVTEKHCSHTTLTAKWLTLDGVGQPVPTDNTPPLPDLLLTYYTNITEAILSSDNELIKISLNDLRTNNKIAALLPYVVSFVSNGVKTSSHDVQQMMKLLYTIKALTSNKHLNLHPLPYLQLLVDSVLYCLLEPLAASMNPLNDHWSLRDYASNLLASISKHWSGGINGLNTDIICRLRATLQDFTKPFSCHYGAVVALIALGLSCIEEVLIPELSMYWSHLDLTLNDPACANTAVMADALKVHCALLLAVDIVLRQKLRLFNQQRCVTDASDQSGSSNDLDSATDTTGGHTSLQGVHEFYTQMYEYFGDGLSLRLPEVDKGIMFKASASKTCVNLGDSDTNKSGEELLDDFMRRVEEGEKIQKRGETKDPESRLKQARLPPVSKTHVSGRNLKREQADDDLYGGSVKRSRLQEEWTDEVREHGGMRQPSLKEEEGSHSSEGSESLHSEKSEEVSYPSVESEVSDPSEGIKIKIKMFTSKASPTVSDKSSPGKPKRKVKHELKGSPHEYQFDDFNKLNKTRMSQSRAEEDQPIPKLIPELPVVGLLKLKLPVAGKSPLKSPPYASGSKYN